MLSPWPLCVGCAPQPPLALVRPLENTLSRWPPPRCNRSSNTLANNRTASRKMCRSSLWTEIIYKTPKVISEVVLVFRNAPVSVEVEHLLLILPDIACEKCERQIALPHQRLLIPGSGCHRCGSTFQGPHLKWDCNGIATIKDVWGGVEGNIARHGL